MPVYLVFKKRQIDLLHDMVSCESKEQDSNTRIDETRAQRKLILYVFGKFGIKKQTKERACCRPDAEDDQRDPAIQYPFMGDEVGAGHHPERYLHGV